MSMPADHYNVSFTPPQPDHTAQLKAAMFRTYDLVPMDSESIMKRMGWSTEQWYEDAVRIMEHEDGAAGSLLNGHVNALIKTSKQAATALRQLADVERVARHWAGLSEGDRYYGDQVLKAMDKA